MMLAFQPRRQSRHRVRPDDEAAPPIAAVEVELVGVDHGTEFDWYLYWQFSGPIPAGLTLADVHGLAAGNAAPVAITDRGDNWLLLRCHCEDGVGDTWLVLAGGSPAFVPGETGVVTEI